MDWTADQGSWLGEERTASVRIRGRDITVRPLTIAQLDTINRLYPLPPAPLGPNPAKGSKSTDLVRRLDDPAYMAKAVEVDRQAEYARIAVATSDAPAIRPDGSVTSDAEARQWIQKCTQAIGLLRPDEVSEIIRAMHESGEPSADPSPA